MQAGSSLERFERSAFCLITCFRWGVCSTTDAAIVCNLSVVSLTHESRRVSNSSFELWSVFDWKQYKMFVAQYIPLTSNIFKHFSPDQIRECETGRNWSRTPSIINDFTGPPNYITFEMWRPFCFLGSKK